MVYISRDGTVYNEKPWGIDKILGILMGVVNMIFAFFQTLLPIEGPAPRDNFRNSGGWRSGWGGGGGGGGGSGGGYPKPGGGPGRPGSNIRGLGSLPPPGPPPACSSCCG